MLDTETGALESPNKTLLYLSHCKPFLKIGSRYFPALLNTRNEQHFKGL